MTYRDMTHCVHIDFVKSKVVLADRLKSARVKVYEK